MCWDWLSDFGVVPVHPSITLLLILLYYNRYKLDRHVVDDKATSYWLDGPSIEFHWVWNFLHPSRPALGSKPTCAMWTEDLSRSENDRCLVLTTYLNLASRLKNEKTAWYIYICVCVCMYVYIAVTCRSVRHSPLQTNYLKKRIRKVTIEVSWRKINCVGNHLKV